jgi:hypothetical protein
MNHSETDWNFIFGIFYSGFLFHMQVFLSCIAVAMEQEKAKYGAKRRIKKPKDKIQIVSKFINIFKCANGWSIK